MSIAIYGLLLTVCTVVTAAGVVSLFRATSHRRRLAPPTAARTPISVLKPLCGADDQLEANLESFFRQRYAAFELIFGVEGADDPAIAVVRRLRARYPGVRARLVVHDGRRALNPKVSNLRAMLEGGSHDVVVISDSNVTVAPDYLARMVAQIAADARVGLVTSLIAGVGERTLGATLENLHLAGTCAGGVALSQEVGGNAASVGKSLMFRRSVFESLGGFAVVGCVLAEDYVMGRMFAEAGYRVRLCGGVVDNVSATSTVPQFVARRMRWGLIRSRVLPLGYLLEPLANPMAVALLAPLFGVFGPAPLMWAIGLSLLRDGTSWIRMRGSAGLAQALPLSPIGDLLALLAWALAPFERYVSWRGRRYRISTGTRLYAEQPASDGPRRATLE